MNSRDSGSSESTLSALRKKRYFRTVVVFTAGVLLWRYQAGAHHQPYHNSESVIPPQIRTPLPVVVQPSPVPPRRFAKKDVPPLLLETPSLPALHNWRAIHQAWPNPLDKNVPLDFDMDLTIEAFPNEVKAGRRGEIVFKCLHNDVVSLCPEAYRVWFEGPTLHSPLYADSEDRPDPQRVKVSFVLNEPGEYRVYAWPEHDKCDHWQGGDILYNKRLVSGSPFLLRVTGTAPRENAELCTSKVPRQDAGRWISKAHINPYHFTPESPYFTWLTAQMEPTTEGALNTLYSFIWAPYECKIPHKSIPAWIETVKPGRLAIFGDSLLRDLFCLIIWPAVSGADDGQCDFYASNYHMSNKHMSYARKDGGVTELHFVWLPQGDLKVLNEFLDGLPTPPTHVLFGAALHLALQERAQYKESISPAVKRFAELAPNTRTLVRTSGGVVQAIQCYDKIGGQRFQMEDLCEAAKELVKETPGVDLFHVYPTLNDRPEATPDGRHWSNVGHYWEARPEIGAAEFALLDAMFHSWA